MPIHQPSRLLIVDDNKVNRIMLSRAVENLGHSIDTAENGLKALEKLRSGSFDLVLLDIEMPELDGYQTTLKIRHELQLNTPIIAMTAHSIVGEKDKCLAVGMNDFISKPVSFEKLRERIRHGLGVISTRI